MRGEALAPVRVVLATLFGVLTWLVQADSPVPMRIGLPGSNGWAHVEWPLQVPGRVFTLSASSNLQTWIPIATLHDGPVNFLDPATPEFRERFYRVAVAAKGPTDDWKNQVAFPADPFCWGDSATEAKQVRWIKFAILTAEPYRVYYQNSKSYLFHYDFARARLTLFAGMSREEFDAVSLHPTNQEAVLGALLYPPGETTAEYGIQFVGLEPYPRESVVRLFELVKSTVMAPAGTQVFYMPAFEQLAGAQNERVFLESKGVRVDSVDRWATADSCYALGWALGRLRFVPGTEIDAAYSDGRLGPTDILLTDGVPAEVPFVAGIIALRPSTPNSHVAILAKSHGLPFVYLANASERERVRGWDGKEVLLRVWGPAGNYQTQVLRIDEDLDPALRAEILALKAPSAISIVPKASFGAWSAPVDGLVPSDIKFFGGKAANFGVLRREIPDHSPPAIAFSFDLWDEFLDQVMPSGKTLRTEIDERLSRYSYPPNVAALRADLAAIRDTITRSAQFTPAQEAAILDAVSVFPSGRKIRFRSSTNVEDSQRFSGAGLYDSYSGCPADDQDDDTAGPSRCDPTERNERGVFRAMKKVYASFYNENAFLERRRLQVDETEVGMAILVHVSTPDEIELANGVATLRVSRNTLQGELVTQAGAVSVTNPDGAAQPEVMSVSRFGFGTFLDVSQRSSLVPLGGYVMTWDSEYRALVELLAKAAAGYQAAVTAKPDFTLDFEYKKIAPGTLSVKQVREVPAPETGRTLSTYLLNEPGVYTVFQGEFGDVFGNHRLKSRWSLASRNLRLVPGELTSSFYTNASVEYLAGAELAILTNGMSAWPGATYSFDGNSTRDTWSPSDGTLHRTFTLQTALTLQVTSPDSPVLSLGNLVKTVSVRYAQPQPRMDEMNRPALATNEMVRLWQAPEVTRESLLQSRTLKAGSAQIDTTFYWPKPPGGFTAGYTAPLQSWVETRITGFTSQPIVLKGYYSQTYRPAHHNFAESFIFEPQLEPGLPQACLDELSAANIRLIYVYASGGQSELWVLGSDDTFRRVP